MYACIDNRQMMLVFFVCFLPYINYCLILDHTPVLPYTRKLQRMEKMLQVKMCQSLLVPLYTELFRGQMIIYLYFYHFLTLKIYMVNAMPADDQEMEGARASAAMVLS